MTNVIPLILPKPPTPEQTLSELLAESQMLATKALDILRIKNELLMKFNSEVLELTKEQLDITARQSEIGLAIQNIMGL